MTVSKPYHRIPIQDCGEALVAIPLAQFAVVDPHPYAVLGAPYGQRSPYHVRAGVLQALLQAQQQLQSLRSGWQIQIFDAYRPIAVQQFMVDYTYQQLLQTWQRQQPQPATPTQEELLAQVYQFWAAPSDDLTTPPPHSTGAAVDITLVDNQGQPVDMGSAIDELSQRSYPAYYANRPEGNLFHTHRQLLADVMHTAGFRQHPNEWWHFSLGDQLWVWLGTESNNLLSSSVARYGRAD